MLNPFRQRAAKFLVFLGIIRIKTFQRAHVAPASISTFVKEGLSAFLSDVAGFRH